MVQPKNHVTTSLGVKIQLGIINVSSIFTFLDSNDKENVA